MLRLKRKKKFATFDLRKGYHQCRLTKRAALLLAVATQDGLVIPITAPFGFHGLPAQFQFFISKEVLDELDGNGIESFIDDLNVNAMDFEELFELIKILFQRLDKWDLRINGAKSVINVPSCIYLGHEVDGEGKQHTAKRVQGIQNMQRLCSHANLVLLIGLMTTTGIARRGPAEAKWTVSEDLRRPERAQIGRLSPPRPTHMRAHRLHLVPSCKVG